MDWIQISRWSDLQRFGINALTGESDPFCMRLLCDLSQEGLHNLANYFGMSMPDFANALRPNWNSQVDGQPAVRSILLQKEILKPLAKWLLFAAAGCKYVIEDQHCLYGTNSEHYAEANAQALRDYERAYKEKGKEPDYTDFNAIYNLQRNCNYQGGAADRNQHQMTGRTE